MLQVVRTGLGLEPAAAFEPVLPPGISRLRVAGLRLHGTALDLEVRRVADGVRLHVLGGPAGLVMRPARSGRRSAA